MKDKIVSKFPQLGTTIFTHMSRLSVQNNAINLGQGFPDFGADPRLLDAVSKQLQEGKNQYGPMEGVIALREQLAKKFNHCYHLDTHPMTDITVTNGATEAIFVAISALVGTGDEVIILDPAFDIYVPAILLNGGIPVRIKMNPDYTVDWQRVRQAINAKTKVLILNSPHNPTGSVLSPTDWKEVERIVDHFGMYLISDEVYEHMVFDGRVSSTALQMPGLKNRTIATFSLGKTLHTTGWRLGYAIACSELMVEFRKIHQFVTFAANTTMQNAVAHYMETDQSYQQLSYFFQRKRDKFRSMLSSTSFEILESQGSYFQLVRYSQISNLPDVAFAEWLVNEHKVASIPMSVFYEDNTDHHIIRFCFAKEDATLEEAAHRLRNL